MAKVVVAMSGGVDSSVAAALLKENGYDVIGATMKTWGGKTLLVEDVRPTCYGPGEEQDIGDARKVAQVLGISHYIFDLKEEYKARVLDYLCQQYLSGRTPNPCIQCNQMVKFDALVRKVLDSGISFDYFATGHYARVEYSKSRYRYLLKKGKDLTKDQSYFLFNLSQEQLGHTLFPLGNYTKGEVRTIARALGLGVSNKPESQNLIAGGYLKLVEAEAKPGPILDENGNVLGQHQGIPFYTVGQRRGLGVSVGERLYVVAIEQERNAIVVGAKKEVYEDELIASDLNWIAVERLWQPVEVEAKIRYLHKEAGAEITPLDGGKVRLEFKEPQMAIAPGQAVVFYDRDVVMGGGRIERAGR